MKTKNIRQTKFIMTPILQLNILNKIIVILIKLKQMIKWLLINNKIFCAK